MRQNGCEKCGRVAVGLGPKTMNYWESGAVNFPADACGKAASTQLIARQENVRYRRRIGESNDHSRFKRRFYEFDKKQPRLQYGVAAELLAELLYVDGEPSRPPIASDFLRFGVARTFHASSCFFFAGRGIGCRVT
ncbi:hypothetical protein K0M31_017162 [Melipona bicolor]|uniref:Uncharacterized protein n=1 Tax=Melipona bicolor TaxID=60889 RepID=A0AA40KS66_9HYME|nr:hypothetical protein K0M31_017162 [Melipona bicolor]